MLTKLKIFNAKAIQYSRRSIGISRHLVILTENVFVVTFQTVHTNHVVQSGPTEVTNDIINFFPA